MKDADAFRTALFERCKELAAERKIPTDEIFDMLKRTGEEIHAAGIDAIYAKEAVDPDAYDVTWLTLMLVKLSTWEDPTMGGGGGGGFPPPPEFVTRIVHSKESGRGKRAKR